jgi:hypothetical protein
VSSILRVAAIAAACVVAGCGDSTRPTAQTIADDPVLQHGPTGQGLTPKLPPRPLVAVEMTGLQTGTNDKIVFGRDGRAVIVRAYGGGGFYSYRCALTAAEQAAVRTAVQQLPLDKAPKAKAQVRKSYYQQYPPMFVLRAGRYTGSFTANAVPRDGRWFVRHTKLMITGHEGHCRETYGQRSR